MTIASKSGGLILKDGRIAQGCECCSAPIVPVCASPIVNCPEDDYERISNIVFRVTFSNFALRNKFGISTNAQVACDAQYGTDGFFSIGQPAFYNDYINLANNFSADLFFEPSLTSPTDPFVWVGSASATTPSGVTVTTYYQAGYGCVNNTLRFGFGSDRFGFTIPSHNTRQAESCSDGLYIRGPRSLDLLFSSFSSSGKSFQCGNVNFPIREFYTGPAELFVGCGLRTTSAGCFVFENLQDANYFRIELEGNTLLTAYENGLP
jgi:hypothetical protein